MLCVAFARRCVCCDLWAVYSGCGGAGRRAGVPDLCVSMLRVSVRCVVWWRALFSVTRAMTLTYRCAGWGLSRRMCLRAYAWCDGIGERGAGWHVRDVQVGPAKM